MHTEGQSGGPSASSDPISSINDAAVLAALDAPDARTILEETDLDRQYLKELIRSVSQNIDERKKYAHRIFCLMCSWLAVCFLILIADGLEYWTHFSLSQPVLLAMIGGTTADVLGIFYIVTHYLFPHSDEGMASKKAAAKSAKRIVDSN